MCGFQIEFEGREIARSLCMKIANNTSLSVKVSGVVAVAARGRQLKGEAVA